MKYTWNSEDGFNSDPLELELQAVVSHVMHVLPTEHMFFRRSIKFVTSEASLASGRGKYFIC